MRRLIHRPSPAMVVACTALIIALGGTSYAALVPRNSVGSKQLRKNAVTKTKIKGNAVTASKVKNGSLDVRDFKAGTVPVGVGTLAYRELTFVADPSVLTGAEVKCPPGLFAISGQIDASLSPGLEMNSSYSSNGAGTGLPGATAWVGVVDNFTAAPLPFTVIVTCAPAGAIVRKATAKTARTKRGDFTLKTK